MVERIFFVLAAVVGVVYFLFMGDNVHDWLKGIACILVGQLGLIAYKSRILENQRSELEHVTNEQLPALSSQLKDLAEEKQKQEPAAVPETVRIELPRFDD